jgi:predicted RNase H-like nuclease (RuvC/YqgF family)
LAVVEDESRKQMAAGSEEQGFTFRTSFDPFNMIMQQLGKLDDKLEKLNEKIDTKIDKLDAKIDGLRQEMDAKIDGLHREVDAKIDGLHQELHNTTRWIIGTIVAVVGVAVALASWLFR